MTADGTSVLHEDGIVGTELAQALSAWAREPVLAAPLADPACAYLVLDGAAARILHASTGAEPLARALADADGTFRAGRSPAEQIRRIGEAGTPRLVRLPLDPRRLAPPTLCLIAGGGRIGDAPALLVVAAGPLPAFRAAARPPKPALADPAFSEAAPASAEAAPASAEADPAFAEAESENRAAPTVGDRILWRSDAADALTHVSGASGQPLAPAFLGRSWAVLAQAGHLLDADAFLSALAERRTVRGSAATLRLDAESPRLAVEMSGAPLGRGGDAFFGYGGFALIRAVAAAPGDGTDAVATEENTAPACEPAAVLDATASHPVEEAEPSLPDAGRAPWPAALPTASRSEPAAERIAEASVPVVRALPVPEAEPPSLPDAALAPWPPALPTASRPEPAARRIAEAPVPVVGELPVPEAEPSDAALSVTEHAAFREIARALGARYAGDDEAAQTPDPAAPARTEGGAVMAFPVAKVPEARAPETVPAPAGAVTALVEDLPAAILVHRGDAVLAANRRLLDLAGYPDLATLQSVGVTRLFRGLAPNPDAADDAGLPGRTVLIETAGRSIRPVEVRQGRISWQGATAGCLLLHAMPEVDHAREAAADRLARTFREAHAADARAALDALDDGIVTLDSDARVVAMNRAAAGLFACDPREVVGGGFASLFDPADADAARAALDSTGSETRTLASAVGRPLALRVSGAGGTRVAVLRAIPEGGAQAPQATEIDRPAFLKRVDHEIRTPLNGILGFADMMLKEPFGALDERYRGYLRDIHASGEHVLGLVTGLFDLANIEAGRLPLSMRLLPLNDLVSACVALLQPEAARGRIVLRTSFSPDLAALEADEPSMRQAALNVIANAIRFTAAGGQVIVSTMPAERGAIALTVRDTGPGMSAEEIEHALEPFREVAVAGPRHGSGLDLPLTKALVEANHGHLRISSRKDEGTLVEILMPGRESRRA